MQELDDDLTYARSELDRSVIAPNQIRTVLETYRDTLFTELFPGRTEVPKTLIFAKDDHHAEEIVTIVREVFGKGNDFAKKITYKTADGDPEELIAGVPQRLRPAHRGHRRHDRHRHRRQAAGVRDLHARRASALYFEQMKGRGARTIDPRRPRKRDPRRRRQGPLRPRRRGRGHRERQGTVSVPLERERTVAFDKLLEQVASGRSDEDASQRSRRGWPRSTASSTTTARGPGRGRWPDAH